MRNVLKLAENISGDIAASIPFHLVRNPKIFITKKHQTDVKQEALVPNVSAGGLLIMHVIYVGSKTSIVPQSTRQSFRENLAWIGKVMGIGQAEVISDVSWNDYVMMLVLTSPLSLQQLFRGNLS